MTVIPILAKLQSVNRHIKPPTVPNETAPVKRKPTEPRKHIAEVAAPVPAAPPVPPESDESKLERRRKELYELEFGHLSKPPPKPAPKPAPAPAPAPAVAPPKPAPTPIPKKDDRKYTMKELIDFDEIDYKKPFINIRTGQPYRENVFGVNPRGDVVDADFNYLGHWDKETKTIIPAKISKERGDGNEPLPILPPDWREIERASQG